MSSATASLNEIATFWRSARRLYTIYSALNRNFELGLAPCQDLESATDMPDPEALARVNQWLEQMDARVQAWQLRQLLQSTNLQTEESLRALIRRYLDKQTKTEIDRDKIDFLLVQYFAHCSPQGPSDQEITLPDVGYVLEPVLGSIPKQFPEWVGGLDQKLQAMSRCDSLEELQATNALVDVRELKLSTDEDRLKAPALIAFTRFNFLARRAFFRAMHMDLHAIRNALNELENRGVSTMDCREAGLTQEETLDHIRHVVHQWKTPFRAPYSGGNSFLPLVALRRILEGALAGLKQKSAAPKTAAPKTKEAPVAGPASQPPSTGSALGTPAVSPVPVAAAAEQNGHESAEDEYLDQCMEDITRQIMEAPPKHGASVTPLTLAGCKLLIATWEAEAFTQGDDQHAVVLKRAVAARTILHVGIERHKKHEPTDLFAALDIAHRAVELMQQEVVRAKDARNIDAAVNLSATSKRLVALIAEGEKLSK